MLIVQLETHGKQYANNVNKYYVGKMKHKLEAITKGHNLDCGGSKQQADYVTFILRFERWVGGHRMERQY